MVFAVVDVDVVDLKAMVILLSDVLVIGVLVGDDYDLVNPGVAVQVYCQLFDVYFDSANKRVIEIGNDSQIDLRMGLLFLLGIVLLITL